MAPFSTMWVNKGGVFLYYEAQELDSKISTPPARDIYKGGRLNPILQLVLAQGQTPYIQPV